MSDTQESTSMVHAVTSAEIDASRRALLARLGKTAAYAAPATLVALSIQANATSAPG